MSSLEEHSFRRRFLRALSHDLREPISTVTWYFDEISDHSFVKSSHSYLKQIRELESEAQSLWTRFDNFYKAYQNTENSLRFKKDLEGLLQRQIAVLIEKWSLLEPDIRHIHFADDPQITIGKVSETLDRLLSKHAGLLRYLDVTDRPEKTQMNVRNEIQNVCRDLSHFLDRNHIDFDQISITGNCKDRFDRILIGLIFQNLFSNSVKYRSRYRKMSVSIGLFQMLGADIKSILLSSRIQRFVKDGKVYNLMIFTDNCRGIPHRSIETVFDPYIQLDRDQNDRDQGSGMGLSIVANAVEVQGGSIVLESEIDVGSQFQIVIPTLNEKIELKQDKIKMMDYLSTQPLTNRWS